MAVSPNVNLDKPGGLSVGEGDSVLVERSLESREKFGDRVFNGVHTFTVRANYPRFV